MKPSIRDTRDPTFYGPALLSLPTCNRLYRERGRPMAADQPMSVANRMIRVTYVRQYAYWRIECPGRGHVLAFSRHQALRDIDDAARYLEA